MPIVLFKQQIINPQLPTTDLVPFAPADRTITRSRIESGTQGVATGQPIMMPRENCALISTGSSRAFEAFQLARRKLPWLFTASLLSWNERAFGKHQQL